MSARHPVRHRWYSTAAAACASILALAGCSGSERPASVPTTPVSAAPSSPALSTESAAAKAKEEVLTVYTSYQQALLTAMRAGDYNSKALTKYVAEPLLGQTRNSIYQIKKAGLINKGTWTWQPAVTDVDLTQKTLTATIEDCTDISRWKTVNRETGKPVPAPSGQPTRYLITSKAKQVSGTWYIAETDGDWNRPC